MVVSRPLRPTCRSAAEDSSRRSCCREPASVTEEAEAVARTRRRPAVLPHDAAADSAVQNSAWAESATDAAALAECAMTGAADLAESAMTGADDFAESAMTGAAAGTESAMTDAAALAESAMTGAAVEREMMMTTNHRAAAWAEGVEEASATGCSRWESAGVFASYLQSCMRNSLIREWSHRGHASTHP